jgi:tRNA-Thr(GGU) m(6)t(6)A37 methyltransferase TsaA
MVRLNEIRPGEVAVDMPAATDAGLVFIGRICTPWTDRLACPRQGRRDGPLCRIELFAPWAEALDGLAQYESVEVLYWLDRSRRDLVRQSPKSDGTTRGTFSLRSPVRPNPIATSLAALVGIEGATVLVRGLDCLDGTPLLDLKPDRCTFTPLAPRQLGDEEVGEPDEWAVARASSPHSRPAEPTHAGWRSRGYLPHFDSPDAVQHVVFRLLDALPAGAMAALDRAGATDRLEVVCKLLREGHGEPLLADRRIAAIVENALLHFDSARYRLLAWCIMPTHVHVLMAQMQGHPLSAVVQSWKSFSAKAANKVLGRQHGFWAPEYYDRFMRHETHLETTRAYIESNPVTAALCRHPADWRFSSAWMGPRDHGPRGLDEDGLRLPDAVGAVDRLFLDGRVPPGTRRA